MTKALVVGLGSMGKRRIRNLKHLGVHDISGYDIREDRRDYAANTYGIRALDAFDWEVVSEYDCVLICTPPDLHMRGAIECAKRGKHFFTELNFVRKDMDKLLAILDSSDREFVAAPSCTLRYHPCVAKMKEMLGAEPLGKPLCFIHHFGEYLPYWHPWESIEDFYVGKRETGGARDIVSFEFEFLTWLFGEPVDVRGFGSGTGLLGVDIDDNFEFVARFSSGVAGSVLVDVLQRKPNRYFRVVAEHGTVIWNDWARQRLHLIYEVSPGQSVDTSTEASYHEEEIDLSGDETGWAGSEFEKIDFSTIMYIHEMEAFLKAVRGQAIYPKSFHDDARTVNALYRLDADHGDSER